VEGIHTLKKIITKKINLYKRTKARKTLKLIYYKIILKMLKE